MSEPESSTSPKKVDLTCDQCDAALTWDPAADALTCEHCGNRQEVEVGEGTILERPLSEAGTAERGLGTEMRALRCESCQARVLFEGVETSKSCPFCGSPQILPQEANANVIRPESLIPLDMGREQVDAAFRKWIGGLWFRPNALKKAETSKALGVYVPAWTFDCFVRSRWSAQAGYYYYVTVTKRVRENGEWVNKHVQERRTRWEPAWGRREDSYDDLLILASRGIDAKLWDKLGSFNTKQLVPYKPEYLAGWLAEEYQVDLEQGWDQGRARVESRQRSRCSSDVPGDTQRSLRVNNQVSDVRWKHILLPVWSLTYAFGGKNYAVLVHGQRGTVVGEAPLSWMKIVGLVLGILAIAGAIAGVAALSG